MKHILEGKQVVVTGGAGFIGTPVVAQLVDAGAKVTVVDNLSNSTGHTLFPFADRITVIQGDITNYNVCYESMVGKDYVIHLAALVDVAQGEQDPAFCFLTNTQGTANLLQSARACAIKRFIFASSAAVYGACQTRCAEDLLCAPMSVYGMSKLAAEQLCAFYTRVYQLPTLSLRYFNVLCMVNDQKTNVAARFIKALRADQPAMITGDGNQTRDFVPLSCVVSATTNALCIAGEHINGQSINVATGKSMTVNELFDQLRSYYPQYHYKPLYLPARSGDIYHSLADITRYYHVFPPNTSTLQP